MNKFAIIQQIHQMTGEALMVIKHRESRPDFASKLSTIADRLALLQKRVTSSSHQLTHSYGNLHGQSHAAYRARQSLASKQGSLDEIDAAINEALRKIREALQRELAHDPYDPTNTDKSVTELINALADEVEGFAGKLEKLETWLQSNSSSETGQQAVVSAKARHDIAHLKQPGGSTGGDPLVLVAIVLRLVAMALYKVKRK
ncbi:MAG: hypothetical protein AAFN78_19300 [Pseudomonadota bacterium]